MGRGKVSYRAKYKDGKKRNKPLTEFIGGEDDEDDEASGFEETLDSHDDIESIDS